MKRRGNTDRSGSSQGNPSEGNDGMERFLQSMMENQQRQMKILHHGLLTAPREQRPGNVSNFRRLQPSVFSGTERPLDVLTLKKDKILIGPNNV